MDVIFEDNMSGQHPSSIDVFELKIWHQMALCAALFTNEVAITYELIYMVTWEKLLGLPVQYVSLPGVISAVVSLTVIPVMGRLGDRGNRFRRKGQLVVFSGGLVFLGAACLCIGCVVKMIIVADIESHLDCTKQRAVAKINVTASSNKSDFIVTNETCLSYTDTDYDFKEHPMSIMTSILAVFTFVLVDIGFDTGGSNIRGFMLECVHKSQHSRVLSLGVIMSGLGGCVISLLGLLNVKLAGQLMDASLVKAITLSLFLMLSVLITLPITLLSGRYLFQRLHRLTNTPLKDVFDQSNNADLIVQNCIEVTTENNEIKIDSYSQNSDGPSTKCQPSKLKQLISNGTSGQSIDKEKRCSNHSISLVAEIINCRQMKAKSGKTNSQCIDVLHKTEVKRSIQQHAMRCPAISRNVFKSHKKLSLLLACLLSFFTSGANATFEIYFSNYLAEGVYQGDGDAPLQSEPKHRYDNGMNTAAVGTFVFQTIFLIYNAVHQKISTESGLVYEFLMVSIMLVPSLLVFIMTQSIIAFYVTIVINGAYRTLVFTTPFILAAETTRIVEPSQVKTSKQEGQMLSDTSEDEDNSYGSVMSNVGAMLPLNFLLSSCIMGPMLKATHESVSPMYYVVSSAVVAIVVLFSLIVTRCRKQQCDVQAAQL